MAKAYRKAPGSGPVPYPDGSGRMLGNEIVIGSCWEQFVALNYVERLEGEVDESMFKSPEPPVLPSPAPEVRVHVGPTVSEMVRTASIDELRGRKPTVIEMARAAASKHGLKATTVTDSARDVLRQRKQNEQTQR